MSTMDTKSGMKIEGGTNVQIDVPGQPEMPGYEPPHFQNYAKKFKDEAWKRVKNAFDYDQSKRRVWEDNWKKYYKIFHGLTDRKAYTGKANLAVPEIYRCVQNIRPPLSEAILGIDPFFKVLPLDQNDQNASVNEKILRAYGEKMSIQQKIREFIDGATLYGTQFAKLYWKRVKGEIIINQPIGEQSDVDPMTGSYNVKATFRKPTVKEDYLYNAPYWENIYIFDIYIPPLAKSVQDCDHVIHEVEVDLAHLKKMERSALYENVDKCMPYAYEPSESDKQARDEFVGGETDDHGTDSGRPAKYRILEYWGKFDLNGNGEEIECEIVVDVKSHTVLRCAKNRFWNQQRPFIAARVDPSADEFYSEGIIGPFIKIQHFLNAVANNTLDAAALQLSPMLVAGVGADIPGNQFYSQPGRILRGNPSQIQPLTINADIGSGHRLMSKLQDMMREGTGANQQLSGLADPSNATAQGYGMMLEQSNMRITRMAKAIEDEAVQPALNFILGLIQQYVTKKESFRVLGEKGIDFIEFDPANQSIGTNYDVVVYGSSRRREQISKASRIREFSQIWASILPPEMQIKLAKKDWELMGLGDPETVWGSDEDGNSLSPAQVFDLILQGKKITAHPDDDHAQRIQQYSQLLQTTRFQQALRQDKGVGEALKDLMQQHMQFLQQMQQAQMQQQQQAQQPPQPAGPGGPPAGPQQGAMNV